MDQPLVSVVMPVFDREWCVAEAIESVLRLDSPGLELVVVDDGSTDGTARILAGLAARDPRVRVLTHPGRANRGIARSRNLGVASSRGKYLAFLDSDDLFGPQRLAHAVPWLESHREFAGCVEPFTVESMGAAAPGPLFRHLIDVPQANHGWLRAMLFANTYWNMPTLTIRREALLQFGGFDEELPVGEDTGLWLRLAAAGAIGVAQGDVSVARVRRHDRHSWGQADRVRECGTFLHILLGLVHWSRQRADVEPEARELAVQKLRGYLVEILSDASLPLAFRLRAWQRSVFECWRLFGDRPILSNVIRAPFRLRQSAG
jgi:hypothetical protein